MFSKVIVLFIMTGVYIGLWLLIYFKGEDKALSRNFSIFVINMAIWTFGLAMFYYSTAFSIALFWTKIVYCAGSLIPSSFLLFSFIFPDGEFKISRRQQRALFVPNILLAFLFFLTPFMVKEVRMINGSKGFIYGRGHFLWDVQFNGFFAWAFWRFIKMYKTSKGIIRVRLRYILLGTLLGVILAGTTNVIMPWFNRFELLWLGPPLTLTWLICVGYAIFKYHLIDIRIALTRTGIFILVYTLVLGLPFGIGALTKSWFMATAIATILASIGPFIYQYLKRRSEDILLKEQLRYQSILRQLSQTMTLIKDVDRLLKLIVYRVAKAVKVEFACIYVAENEQNKLMQKFTFTAKGVFPNFPKEMPHNCACGLCEYIRKKHRPVFSEELSEEMRRNFNFKSGIIVPSFVRERLIGFLILGPKISGGFYGHEDASVFEVLANQAALAIENTEFINESQKTQAQLFAAERMTSMGAMAGGMSHQINNRFHAILLATSDTLDTMKFLDTASYPQQEKEFLGHLQHVLERIEENAKHGGKIVNDFLNFSQPDRLQKQAREFSLLEPLERAIEMAKIKTSFPNDTIERIIPADLPLIQGDFVLLQDVFFNLIDNAVDALKRKEQAIRDKHLPEISDTPYKGKVTVSMHRDNAHLSIQIQDNGIGLSEEAKKKLFVPFFTTKATSSKGTGLGLFVIEKIILAHKGQIKIDSEYGQGTSFIIRLPLTQT